MLHRASCVNKFDQPYKKEIKLKTFTVILSHFSFMCAHLQFSVRS